MTSQSIWIPFNNQTQYKPLQKDISVDIAIIGGGVCGVTLAKILTDKNLEVALLEGHRIAESNTGRSTGNLYSIVDIPLKDLISKYDDKTIQNLFQFRKDAIDFIEKMIVDNEIECSFKRVPWIRFSGAPECDEMIQKEYQLANRLGLNPVWLETTHHILVPVQGRMGFLIPHQAQFNPYEYVTHLAKSISTNAHIFEETRVEEINQEDGFYFLKTPNGMVKAKHVVEATHTPLGFSTLQTILGPYREYGVAGLAKNHLGIEGIHWGYYEPGKVTSIRSFEKDAQKYTLVIGEPHKVGQGNSQESIDKLIKRGKDLSLFHNVNYEWGGQHYRPADHLPYIGKNSMNHEYVATGFSTDGLVYGTLAALIIGNIINDEAHPAQELFKVGRITPVKSAKKFIHENLNVAKQYVVDYLHKEKSHDLKNGEGLVIDYDNHKYALSRDEDGTINVCSAICTHLGCVVHWNNAEHSWDCPCHGSRFTDQGKVIEGPALKALESIETASESKADTIYEKNDFSLSDGNSFARPT